MDDLSLAASIQVANLHMPDITIVELPQLLPQVVQEVDPAAAVETDDEFRDAVTVKVPRSHVIDTVHTRAVTPLDMPVLVHNTGFIAPCPPVHEAIFSAGIQL